MEQLTDIELKPCPFCGGSKLKLDAKKRDGKCIFYVRCNKCHARGSTSSYKTLAVEKWNTRT